MTMLALTLATLALSAVPPSKAMAIVSVPVDSKSDTVAVKVEGFVGEALKEFQGVTAKTSDELFAVAADPDAEAALKRADALYAEGKQAFVDRKYDVAEGKFRKAVKDYTLAAPAMLTCTGYCDTLAGIAACLQLRGDTEEAKLALLDLVALSPTFELDLKRYSQAFLTLRAQVAGGKEATLSGPLKVTSRPAGARVVLDGTVVGTTPLALETVRIGKHIVRVERPGFRRYAGIIDLDPSGAKLSTELAMTSDFKVQDDLQKKIPRDLNEVATAAALKPIHKRLAVDRSIVAIVKDAGELGGEIVAGLYNQAGENLAYRRMTFQEGEFGELRAEVARMVNFLMNTADAPASTSRSSDPMERASGTEDWGKDDKGGKSTKKDKGAKGDPLKSIEGTEGW